MAHTLDSKLQPLLRRQAVIRTRDLARLGVPRTALEAPLADGTISRLSHGVYAVTGHDVSEHHSLAQAAVRVPQGVVCLLSALVFHEPTTQTPHEVWLAIDRKARSPEGLQPRIPDPQRLIASVKKIRFSRPPPAAAHGVELSGHGVAESGWSAQGRGFIGQRCGAGCA
jgi:predicted transcriptional regulator of viral defense system